MSTKKIARQQSPAKPKGRGAKAIIALREARERLNCAPMHGDPRRSVFFGAYIAVAYALEAIERGEAGHEYGVMLMGLPRVDEYLARVAKPSVWERCLDMDSGYKAGPWRHLLRAEGQIERAKGWCADLSSEGACLDALELAGRVLDRACAIRDGGEDYWAQAVAREVNPPANLVDFAAYRTRRIASDAASKRREP